VHEGGILTSVEDGEMTADVPRIFRVIVPVSDLERAVRFYSQLLGMPGRGVGGGRHYFDCGPVILALLDDEKPPNAESLYLSVANLEEVHARAKQLGCLSGESVHGASAAEMIVRPWRERSFYAFDPFGNGLCFVDEATVFTGR
jgi:catechol 2,3-dioxygenase-like lactoylglutathione lyase family enzyme